MLAQSTGNPFGPQIVGLPEPPPSGAPSEGGWPPPPSPRGENKPLAPVAIVAGYPIQFFPAAHIVEHALGCRHDAGRRRALRIALNGLLWLVATQGGRQFGHFVSLAGALCAVRRASPDPVGGGEGQPPISFRGWL